MAPKSLPLFGGNAAPWKADDWIASDDRVRGGSSQSYLEIVPAHSQQPILDSKPGRARFHGTLDTKTLGGAGFASQRTVATNVTWDLSRYDGIELRLSSSNTKRYTFILKDALLDPDLATGRERATLSWEYDFVVSAAPTHSGSPHSPHSLCDLTGCSHDHRDYGERERALQHGHKKGAKQQYDVPPLIIDHESCGTTNTNADALDSSYALDLSGARLGLGSQHHGSDASRAKYHSCPTLLRIPWSELRPTYRGREQSDVNPLNTASIKRFSIMMRSFFDEQHGDFELYIDSIAAYKEAEQSFSILPSLLRCLGWRI